MHETFDLGEYQCQLFGGHVRTICFIQFVLGVCVGQGYVWALYWWGGENVCLIQFVWDCLCGVGDMYDHSGTLG